MSSTVLRPPASQDISSGRTIRWLGANNPTPGLRKTRPKPIIYSIYRAQEVYPLSPLLGGGFPKEGGDACSTTNSFGIGGGCGTGGEVSQMSRNNKMWIETLRLTCIYVPGDLQGLRISARGEQSVRSGRTIRWLGANNPTPGLRKTRPKPIIYSVYRAQEEARLSALSSGEVFQRRGEMRVRLSILVG